MPNPDALRREAQRIHDQAASLERQAADVENRLRTQEQAIRNLEQTRQDWQNRLHQFELQLSRTDDPNQSNGIHAQIQDVNNKLRDMDQQIQTARNEHDKIAH